MPSKDRQAISPPGEPPAPLPIPRPTTPQDRNPRQPDTCSSPSLLRPSISPIPDNGAEDLILRGQKAVLRASRGPKSSCRSPRPSASSADQKAVAVLRVPPRPPRTKKQLPFSVFLRVLRGQKQLPFSAPLRVLRGPKSRCRSPRPPRTKKQLPFSVFLRVLRGQKAVAVLRAPPRPPRTKRCKAVLRGPSWNKRCQTGQLNGTFPTHPASFCLSHLDTKKNLRIATPFLLAFLLAIAILPGVVLAQPPGNPGQGPNNGPPASPTPTATATPDSSVSAHPGAPFTPPADCIVAYAATPAQLCPIGGGLQYYFIGAGGCSQQGP